MQFEPQQSIPSVHSNKPEGEQGGRLQRFRAQFAYSTREKMYYWGRPITRYSVSLDRGRMWLRRFELLGSFFFGTGFLFLAGWGVYRGNRFLELFDSTFWIAPTTYIPFSFWLAIIMYSFFVYRVIAGKKQQQFVESSSFDAPGADAEAAYTRVDWPQVLAAPEKSRVDIASTYTKDAFAVIESAYRLADSKGAARVEVPHIFYTVLHSEKIASIFVRLGIPPKTLQAHIERSFQKQQGIDTTPLFSDDVVQVLCHAYEYAYDAQQDYVHTTEVLLAAVLQSVPIQELLYDLGVEAQKLHNVIEWLRIQQRLRTQYSSLKKAGARRSKYGLDRAMTAVATPYLNSFSQDVTMAAKFGKLMPCVARDKEIDNIFRVVEGGRQSVLLVGDRGVGKMSIIEGIAQRMIEDRVPERLQDKRLVQISISALLAGTTVSGAQERIINIMNEVARAKNIILVVDNIHDLMGAGNGEAGLDVSETLAEYLGSGAFLTLATTTPDGYNQHMLDAEIGQVFSRIDVVEMDTNQAIQVLESKVGGVEYKQKVYFSYDALAQSVELADKFLNDLRLPESAMGIMSEAASHVRSTRGEKQLVQKDDVAHIVSTKTGIPTTSISEDESSKLLRLEDEMHKRVIGQDEAVILVANALRRARAAIRSENRPIANFLFLGPTGVGKTELAKTIASVYFGGEERMIRIDMSEFQDKTGVYRLIGQPGQQGTGLLTEAVRQQPFSLVLLDEMEKADPDILNLFLQVFDDGRLTDSTGRVIDFSNTIIIATSNAGTNYVQDQLAKGESMDKIRDALIRSKLREYYRPEFLNRFDGIVLFKALEREEVKKIALLMLSRVEKDLEKRGVFFRVEEPALEALAEVGFDPQFGARPMRRAIQDRVENQLAELVLAGKLNRRDTIVLGTGADIRIEKQG